MKWFNCLVAVLALCLLPATGYAEPNDGSVTGQLVNKTSGGGSTAGTTYYKPSGERSEAGGLLLNYLLGN